MLLKHLNVFLGRVKPENFIFDRTLKVSMEVACIPFKKTGYFSSLISDYLDENKKLEPFYNRFRGPIRSICTFKMFLTYFLKVLDICR